MRSAAQPRVIIPIEHPQFDDAEPCAIEDESRLARAAKKEFDERIEAYKKALDEINKLNLQLEAPTLSADGKNAKAKERDEKIASVKNMEREINEFRQTREQQLQEQMLRMRDGIVKDITDVVMERVKTGNFDLVFDQSGASSNGFSPLLFSRESVDFTAEIVRAVNHDSGAAAKRP